MQPSTRTVNVGIIGLGTVGGGVYRLIAAHVGIIGLGTVGGGVYRLIAAHAERYRKNLGIDLRIARVCNRSEKRARELGIDPEQFTSDWRDIVSDPSIDIVVEVIGGEHPATEMFEQSFAAGKHVVTANKASTCVSHACATAARSVPASSASIPSSSPRTGATSCPTRPSISWSRSSAESTPRPRCSNSPSLPANTW